MHGCSDDDGLERAPTIPVGVLSGLYDSTDVEDTQYMMIAMILDGLGCKADGGGGAAMRLQRPRFRPGRATSSKGIGYSLLCRASVLWRTVRPHRHWGPPDSALFAKA